MWGSGVDTPQTAGHVVGLIFIEHQDVIGRLMIHAAKVSDLGGVRCSRLHPFAIASKTTGSIYRYLAQHILQAIYSDNILAFTSSFN
jgi:hypothetical protein